MPPKRSCKNIYTKDTYTTTIIIIINNNNNNNNNPRWDFDIKSDHLISARRPDLIIINKKKVPVV